MTRILGRIVLFVLLNNLAAAAQQPQVSKLPSLPSVTRGETVTVQGSNLPAQGVKAFLQTGREKDGDNGTEIDAVVAADGKSLSFKVPKEHFETGRYIVVIKSDAATLPVPGELRVLSDQAAKLKVDSIYPPTDFRSDAYDGYEFEISGENLGQFPNDNMLEIVDQGPLAAGTVDECKKYADTGKYEKICLSYDPGMETRKLKVKGFHPAHYEGPVNFRLRVGDGVSETKRVIFSAITSNGLRALAIFVSFALAVIVLAVVWKGVRLCSVGECYGFLDSFFLDKETMSYSLSKFQLVAWTIVVVFGYVYVYFCRILIQWDYSFPSIPASWAGLLGLSAGTTVAAVGITATRGPKGGGAPTPSFADFISTGGLVTSDRFQYFVWTLLGCLSFLVLIVMSDPSKLKDLPSVPDGFLLFMGVSAAGYLGGKLVRLPGPVISQLLVQSVTPAGKDQAGKDIPAKLVIRIKGENLSLNASVKVDDDQMRPDEFTIAEVKAQNQPADPSFRSEILVTLLKADKCLEGAHELSLSNRDGQMATADFPVDPLTIDPVDPLTEGGQTIHVKGRNFEDNTTAEWRDPGSNAAVAIKDIKKVSDKELQVNLPSPATKGQGQLILLSAIGLRARATVQVNPKSNPAP